MTTDCQVLKVLIFCELQVKSNLQNYIALVLEKNVNVNLII